MTGTHLLAVVRAPVGRLDGALAGWHPADLLAHVLTALAARAAVEPATVAEVIVGCVTPAGAQGANVARAAAIIAGWDAVPASTVEDGAASGHRAFLAAVDRVLAGADVVVAAGVEVASVVPQGAVGLGDRFGRPWGPAFAKRFAHTGGVAGPVETARRVAHAGGVTAADEVAWSAEARRRAALVRDATIVPIPAGRGAVTIDEPVEAPTPGADLLDPADVESNPVLAPPADGCAAALIVSDHWLATTGRTALARVGATTRLACPPFGNRLLLAEALVRSGPAVDVVELDDRLAASCLATIRALGLDPSGVNPAGGMLGRGDTGGASFLTRLAALLAAVPDAAAVAVVSADDLGGATATQLALDVRSGGTPS